MGGYLDMPQAEQEATSTDKPITKCPKNMSEAGYICVCLNARSIVNKKKGIKHYGRRYCPSHNWYYRIMGQIRHNKC